MSLETSPGVSLVDCTVFGSAVAILPEVKTPQIPSLTRANRHTLRLPMDILHRLPVQQENYVSLKLFSLLLKKKKN